MCAKFLSKRKVLNPLAFGLTAGLLKKVSLEEETGPPQIERVGVVLYADRADVYVSTLNTPTDIERIRCELHNLLDFGTSAHDLVYESEDNDYVATLPLEDRLGHIIKIKAMGKNKAICVAEILIRKEDLELLAKKECESYNFELSIERREDSLLFYFMREPQPQDVISDVFYEVRNVGRFSYRVIEEGELSSENPFAPVIVDLSRLKLDKVYEVRFEYEFGDNLRDIQIQLNPKSFVRSEALPIKLKSLLESKIQAPVQAPSQRPRRSVPLLELDKGEDSGEVLSRCQEMIEAYETKDIAKKEPVSRPQLSDSSLDMAYKTAHKLYEKGDFRGGLNICQERIETIEVDTKARRLSHPDPVVSKVYELTGDFAEKLNRPSLAQSYFRRAIGWWPDNERAKEKLRKVLES